MPTINDYPSLDMTYVNVDDVTSPRSILRADYGEGYADTAIVGAPGGRKQFALSAGVWPDSVDQPLISGETIMEYYWSFFEARLDAGNEPFIIEWRSRSWLVELAEPQHGVSTHTSDLFTPHGITLNMRRVSGLTHALDGSLFDPSLILSSTWGRFRNAQTFPDSLPFPWINAWMNEATGGNNHSLEADLTDVVSAPNVLGTHDAVRLSSTTNDGFLYDPTAIGDEIPGIYEAFFVMKMREATFSNNAGILSADETIVGLVGQSGTTKFFDIGLTADQYEYKKNNVAYAINDQQAPMNEFGVVHARFLEGKVLENLQIGKDRDFADRFAEVDFIEILLCDELLNDLDSEACSRYLMTYYGIS